MARLTCVFAACVSLAALGVASAHAADLIIETPVEAGIVDVSGSWDGVYVGGFVGWAGGEYGEDDGDFETDIDGWLAGLAVGADFTVADGIVAGVVADIAWTDIGFSDPGYDFNIDWAGSVRGKLGLDAGSFLPYLTAGLAVAGATAEGDFDDSAVHIGWTAGAGVEFALAENISVDLLYRYSDYGSEVYNTFENDYDIDFNTHQVSVGLNWRF